MTHAAGFKTGLKEVQVFHTGVEAPASTNQAPLVDAWVKPGVAVPGQVDLVGTAKDDGLPGRRAELRRGASCRHPPAVSRCSTR